MKLFGTALRMKPEQSQFNFNSNCGFANDAKQVKYISTRQQIDYKIKRTTAKTGSHSLFMIIRLLHDCMLHEIHVPLK